MNRPQKNKKNYAFIDNQNLNLGIQKLGWKMDWRKFRAFLRDSYGVDQAFMFIGYMPEYEDLYEQMHDAGYLIVLKPTLEMFKTPPAEQEEVDAQQQKPYKTYGEQAAETVAEHAGEAIKRPVKGNVDAELVLYAVKEMPNYQKGIIISGDGDFYSLVEYMEERGKLLHLMVPNRLYSSLLKPFDKYIVRLDQRRRELEYRPRRKK